MFRREWMNAQRQQIKCHLNKLRNSSSFGRLIGFFKKSLSFFYSTIFSSLKVFFLFHIRYNAQRDEPSGGLIIEKTMKLSVIERLLSQFPDRYR